MPGTIQESPSITSLFCSQHLRYSGGELVDWGTKDAFASAGGAGGSCMRNVGPTAFASLVCTGLITLNLAFGFV